MGWQPTRLTREQVGERRLDAARVIRANRLTQAEIARDLEVSRAAVTGWKQRLEQEGLSGLYRRSAPGRPASRPSDGPSAGLLPP